MNKTDVYITVDTEHSIGGAFQNPKFKPVGNKKRVFGRIGDKQYGIPLIMDIADRYGLKIVFFVEVLNKYVFGEDETRKVCDYIQERGHEIQLHLHPHYLNFKEIHPEKLKYKDNLYLYGLDEQTALLEKGRYLLERYDVQTPVAFRAGNYGFNRSSLTALKNTGFRYDSSYNHTFIRQVQGFGNLVLNDAKKIDGIWEFPITNFIQTFPKRKPKPLDLNGVSSNEMIRTLQWANKSGLLKHITIILHSFSFLEPLDVQYSKVRVRQYVINRFNAICRFLSENKNSFCVRGFNGLVVDESDASSHEFLQMPKWASARRLAQQALHRFI